MGVSIEDLAPDAISQEEASGREHIWRMMVWGPPGVGKTHFMHTMPEPIVVLDTERKAHDISHKFEGKNVYLFQPENYEEAVDMLHQGLDVLDHFRTEEDMIGTIGIDSMTDMWEWAQRAYARQYYPTADSFSNAKSQFTTGFGKGESDWKIIKEMHNGKFREVMVDSPYNLCWTAMGEDDYSAAMEGHRNRQKPGGEKKNEFQADTIIHIDQDDQGVPVASLEKCGLIKNRFMGLYYPTFEDVIDIIHDIDEAESNPEGVPPDQVTDHDVQVVSGNPRYMTDNE